MSCCSAYRFWRAIFSSQSASSTAVACSSEISRQSAGSVLAVCVATFCFAEFSCSCASAIRVRKRAASSDAHCASLPLRCFAASAAASAPASATADSRNFCSEREYLGSHDSETNTKRAQGRVHLLQASEFGVVVCKVALGGRSGGR